MVEGRDCGGGEGVVGSGCAGDGGGEINVCVVQICEESDFHQLKDSTHYMTN